jgi:hypothetical protein
MFSTTYGEPTACRFSFVTPWRHAKFESLDSHGGSGGSDSDCFDGSTANAPTFHQRKSIGFAGGDLNRYEVYVLP